MTRLLQTTLLVATCLFTFTAAAQKKEESQVRKCFDGYKSAILNDKGNEAADFVDQNTISYYNDMLEKVKYADSISVDAFGLMDKLMVFIIRQRTSHEQCERFDGKSLLVFAINEGMVGKNSVMGAEVGKVKIDGDFATGEFINNGEKTPFNYEFNKEYGTWKLDITALIPIGEPAFRQMQIASGQSENEYLFSLLEMLSGEKPGKEIWETIPE